MQFTFLGTSAGSPTVERNVTALALQFRERSPWWLFDCGEGTQQRILRTSLRLPRLQCIFITHLHGDHCYGLFGLLTSRGLMNGSSDQPLTLIGPKGLKKMVETVLRLSYSSRLSYELNIIEFTEAGQVYEDEFATVHCMELSHDVPSFAFCIEEKDRPGEFLIAKAKEAGIAPGPIYAQLKKGETVTLDGKAFCGKDFVSEAQPGRKVIVSGDNDTPALLAPFGENADLIIHESTHTEAAAEGLSFRNRHSTAASIATYAQEAQAKNLILTHFSARFSLYPKADAPMSLVEDEAKKHYHGNLNLAQDFDFYELNRQGELTLVERKRGRAPQV